jgi:hypothetical protein
MHHVTLPSPMETEPGDDDKTYGTRRGEMREMCCILL